MVGYVLEGTADQDAETKDESIEEEIGESAEQKEGIGLTEVLDLDFPLNQTHYALMAIDGLQKGIKRWTSYAVRYEKRMKDALHYEIKLAGFEALVPEDLERHINLNMDKLRTRGEVRAEVRTYIEAKTGLQIRNNRPSGTIENEDEREIDSWSVLSSGENAKKETTER